MDIEDFQIIDEKTDAAETGPRHRFVDVDDVEDIENLWDYRSGGLHPLCIGDHLNHRYRVIYKLGQGTYSTVWMARDMIEDINVAIKVGGAYSNGASECRILSHLQAAEKTESQQLHANNLAIPLLKDHFYVQGPNGTHPCLVTQVASMSMKDACEVSDIGIFQLPVARAAAAQLACAIKYIHERGVVHGGK